MSLGANNIIEKYEILCLLYIRQYSHMYSSSGKSQLFEMIEQNEQKHKERDIKILEYLRKNNLENSTDIRDLKNFAEENNYPDILKYIDEDEKLKLNIQSQNTTFDDDVVPELEEVPELTEK